MRMFPKDPMGFERALRAPLLTLVLVLSLAAGARATVINVPADQPTIQAGIDIAGSGDTVLVAPGYYLENINFQGKEIVVSSHFLLNRDPAFIFSTIIDGSNPARSDSASTVRIFCAGSEAPVFQGFTVTGGRGTCMLDATEGVVYRNGGGIATSRGAPVIRFNYIHHNQPDGPVNYGGGGIYLQRGNPIVENNIIMYNPGWYGCGLCVRAAVATARNNFIAFNSGGEQYGGAGMYLYGGQLDGYNNTVAFNSSLQAGGGVRVAQGVINLWNSVVWGNLSVISPQVYIDPLFGGTVALEYSDIQGGYTGTGNIDADPGFVGSWCFLGEGSPCIDAGDADPALNDPPWPSAPTAARWPSRGGLRNDMGAWGGPGCYPLELAAIYTSGTLGWVPWEVGFEAESYLEADSWHWEFGDGDGAVSQAAVHTYDDPGAYDVTLTIGYGGGEIYEYTREGLVYALADTMWAGDLEFAPLVGFTPVEILVQARNSVPLDNIVIPIAYSGDLQLLYDGFTTAECRTVDFDTQIEHFRDPVTKTALIELAGNPGLPPGNGPILKLLFYAASAQDGQAATISLASELIPVDPQFLGGGVVYQPVTVDGSILCDCCSGRVGDANGSGEDEPTISDISILIDAKFITGTCEGKITCVAESDVNQSGGPDPSCDDITISDISTLIDYLFITGPETATLPECL